MNFKIIFKYYWMQIRKYPRTFWGIFVFYGCATVVGNIFTPLVYRRIIDVISHASDRAVTGDTLMWLVVVLVGIMATYSVLYRLGDFCMSYFQSNVIKELADYSFEQTEKHSYRFFTDTFAGSLVAKTKRFVRAFEAMHDTVVFTFWTALLILLGVFVVLIRTNALLAFYFFFWLVIYFIVILVFVRKRIPYERAEAAEDSRVTARLSDAISNILNIKMFASRLREHGSFKETTKNEYTARMRLWYLQNLQFMSQGILLSVLEVGGMYFAIRLWLSGDISAGTIVLIQIYSGVIFGQVWNLGKSIARFTQSFSDASEMVEIFEQPIDVKDLENPEECRIAGGEVKFEKVTFGYHHEAPVLSDFSFAVHAGEKVGLVGSSGAGKTTITKLLLRFADPQSGAITIDGQNISQITQDDLRRAIAYVPQDPVLFHRSLRENIAYGKPDASEEEIIVAAKKAHAHEFISGFHSGYDTLVGERGVKLSGGERQRVAIARAILKNAPILILDEATSSLDTVSERLIQDALHVLMEGKTVIVIAHRLSTVRTMDRIAVLGESGVLEEGTHEYLIAKGGTYATFWNHQTDGLLA